MTRQPNANQSLFNKHILLAVTGSVAAYKAGFIIRDLQREGAHVRVVMTAAATEFVTPMTFQALSGNPVHTDLLNASAEAAMGHIELARWADAIVVAPASANSIARIAQGQADDLLTAVILAHPGHVAVAPAMNQQMWKNSATSHNVDILLKRGIRIFGPDLGDQACGDVGPGRMMEPQEVVRHCADMFLRREFSGKTVLLTAGPTREAIDPVRYISNRSSGKMGYALAEAIIEFGGHCILVSGPVALPPPPRVEVIAVESAAQMYTAVFEQLERCQVFIGCAAVADYRPLTVTPHKLKKTAADLTLHLTPTEDILAAVARTGKVFCVGFAAETDDLELQAERKLTEKGVDMIAANWVNRPGLGFDQDENALSVVWQGGGKILEHARKPQLARQLLQLVAERCKLRASQGT